jgi:hypothetical protein
VMQSEMGANIGYQFARSRAFRSLSRFVLKTTDKKSDGDA